MKPEFENFEIFLDNKFREINKSLPHNLSINKEIIISKTKNQETSEEKEIHGDINIENE